MELSLNEKKAVVSALFQRILKIDQLLSCFTMPELVSLYTEEKILLENVIKKML